MKRKRLSTSDMVSPSKMDRLLVKISNQYRMASSFMDLNKALDHMYDARLALWKVTQSIEIAMEKLEYLSGKKK